MSYSTRLKTFQKNMSSSVAVFFSDEKDDPNLFYFTGFKGFGVLIVYKNKKPVFVTSKLDAGNVKNKSLKIIVLKERFSDVLQKLVGLRKTVGFDYGSLSVANFGGLKKILKPRKTIDISPIVLKQRITKDADEIKAISKACKVSSDILDACAKKLKNFKTEADVRSYLETETKKRGYHLAFDTIVASAANGALPHYLACSSKLKKGFLVVDWGIKVDGYCADMCRTFYIGKPSKKEIEVYNKVLHVQKTCVNMFKQNKTVKEIDTFAQKELGKAYIHALGHGIGINVHELPYVSIANPKTLANGTTFTVEPGVYYKGKFGIRIEDTLVKIKGKIKNLTPMSKELIVINKKGL